MPRRARVLVEGLIYHVYNRMGRGEAPFNLGDEAERFWNLQHDVKSRDGLSVYACCIMPNHYHLAVWINTVPPGHSLQPQTPLDGGLSAILTRQFGCHSWGFLQPDVARE